MKNFLVFCVILIILQIDLNRGCKLKTKEETKKKDWWETAQFYQIYPRSFKDSNGDGIGDLRGIIEKLPYLKEIGVTATWLSPIFKSPMKDFGYDISDFYDIQPEYGNLDDFNALIKAANEQGIKIILDFVPNHSSNESEWFKKSVNREIGYEDFYVWHDGCPDPKDPSKRVPPSNWLQSFRGSAWEWNEKRKQYYLHQFTVQQPDLNYRNPAVVSEMKNVLSYWLRKGVAGFRIDAVPNLFETKPKDGCGGKNGCGYPDEPPSGLTDDKDNSAYLNHIYTTDQPETVDMVYQWRKVLDDHQRIFGGDSRVLLTETYSPMTVVRQYYGDYDRNGAQIPFNFNFILHTNKTSKAKDFDDVITNWLKTMPATSTPNWVLGNHDNRRTGSRYGEERIDSMNMMLMMLPGVSVTYNGEEIGMLDNDISWEESVDPAACNSNKNIYQHFTRDPERSPFQWDTSKNAGFSTGEKTWLPVNKNYLDINVEKEKSNEPSHLSIYKKLVQLRGRKTLSYGTMKHGVLGNDVLVIERKMENEPTYILVANIGSITEIIDLRKIDQDLPLLMTCEIVSVKSARKIGDQVTTKSIVLDGYESIVIRNN